MCQAPRNTIVPSFGARSPLLAPAHPCSLQCSCSLSPNLRRKDPQVVERALVSQAAEQDQLPRVRVPDRVVAVARRGCVPRWCEGRPTARCGVERPEVGTGALAGAAAKEEDAPGVVTDQRRVMPGGRLGPGRLHLGPLPAGHVERPEVALRTG